MQTSMNRLRALQRRKLFFNALVIENTTRCNARCGMCYQAAGPKGSVQLGDAALEMAELEPMIHEALAIENLHPTFHLGGGEAFLNLENCLALFRLARQAGFVVISAVTNGYWARKMERARQICYRLRQAGLTRLEISWDYWHLGFVPPEAVSNCLEACHEVGIQTILRLLSTRSHSYEEALAYLRPAALERTTSISGNLVTPNGRGAELDPADILPNGSLEDNCHTSLFLTVNALGNVYPCCSGFEQTKEYLFGNIRQQPIKQIVEGMERSLLLKTIVFEGVGALLPVLEEGGFAPGRDFSSICHLCWSIFSNPEYVKTLDAYFFDLEMAQLASNLATSNPEAITLYD